MLERRAPPGRRAGCCWPARSGCTAPTVGRGRADRGRAGRPAQRRARLRRPPSWPPRCSCTATGEMYGQQFTILRYGIPYGPRMRDALVVARFVRAALDGQPITIAGTGEQQRNYVYVEDLADAHVRALAPAAADQTLALEGGTAGLGPGDRRHGAQPGRPGPGSSTCPPATADYERRQHVRQRWPRNCSTGRRSRPSPRASGEYLDWLAAQRQSSRATGSAGAAAVRLARHGPRRAGRRPARPRWRGGLVDRDAGRDAAARRAADRPARRCSAPCSPCPACTTPSTSPRCVPAAGWRCSPTPRPGARSCPGCATTSTSIPADLAISVFATGASAVSSAGRPLPGHEPRRLLHRRDAAPALGASERGPLPGHRRGGRARRAPVPAGGAGAGRARRRCGPASTRRPRRQAARDALGIPRERALRAADVGGLGPRPGRRRARGAGRRRVHVLAVAGRNARLEREARRGRRHGSRGCGRSASPTASPS